LKAAILEKLHEPLAVRSDVQIPALTRGQVLVKLAYSGVCHSQLMEARGGRGHDAYLPHLLGHEGTGVVESVGPDVTRVKPGQKVILTWIKASTGIEAACPQYSCGSQKVNSGRVTTFNEYAIVSENRAVPLPQGLPMDEAVLFGCALLTGAGIVTNTIKPKAGSTIAVFGLGGIGLSALMATNFFECSKVIGVDVEQDKLSLARELGATHVIDSSKTDPVMAIRELTSGVGLDYSVEAAGRIKTIEQAYNSIRKNGGLCVFASHPPTGEKIQLDPHDLISGKQIMGTWGGACDPDKDIPLFASLYREGKLPLKKMITKRYSLDQINEALDDIEARRVARPLIEINSELG